MQTPLLTHVEVAARLGVSRRTLYQILATDPTFPRPIRLTGRVLRFRPDDVDAWISRRADAEARPAPLPEGWPQGRGRRGPRPPRP